MRIKFFIGVCLVAYLLSHKTYNRLMCEEIMQDIYFSHEMTFEESGEYVRQQKELFDLHRGLPRKCAFPVRILRFVDGKTNSQLYINPPFVIDKNALQGYTLEKNIRIDQYDEKRNPYERGRPFIEFKAYYALEEQLKNSNNYIEVCIVCTASMDASASFLFELWETPSIWKPSSKPPGVTGLGYWRFQEGPGDKCLISVSPEEKFVFQPWHEEFSGTLLLRDTVMYFVRGNIAVRLQSSIDNFGCMDLAQKLDALLLEEAQKQIEENMEK